MMLTSTLGPLPSHCSLYSPALRLVPLMLVGLFKVKFALLAANALEASVKANPTTKLFVTVANFIAAPFSSPKNRNWLGAARSRTTRENTCVSPRIAYNAAAADQRNGRKASASALGVVYHGTAKRAGEKHQTQKSILNQVRLHHSCSRSTH